MKSYGWMRGVAAGAKGPRARRRPGRAGFRPTVDAVEARVLLSTLTVTSAADAGDGSLRAEVAAAAPGDVIQFASGLRGQTIALSSGPIAIAKSLTIQGPGAGRISVDAGGRSGIFAIDGASTTAVIAGLTLAHGSATAGGAIASTAGSLTVLGVTFSANTADRGGALAQTGGRLTVSASTFAGNTADGTTARGGAIYDGSAADVRIANTRFSGNRALGATQGAFPDVLTASADGGAIFDESDVTATITSSTFANNRASGGFLGASGGAIATDTGATTAGRLTVANSRFSGNAATGLTGQSSVPGGPSQSLGSSAVGGAIASRVALTITNTRFDGNSASGSTGVDGPNFAFGGAIYATGTPSAALAVSVANTTFANNRAVGGSGPSGGSDANGGAIDLGLATTDITGSSFLGNRAQGGSASGANGRGGVALGGAIAAGQSISLTRTQFLGNQALGGSGTGGASGNDALGGALASGGTATLARTTFLGNLARGGSGSTGGSGVGGAISSFSPLDPTLAKLSASDSLITLNSAQGGSSSGGAASGQGLGGGIAALSGTPALTRTRVVLNRASTSGNNVYTPPTP